jgi:hypothetical protein
MRRTAGPKNEPLMRIDESSALQRPARARAPDPRLPVRPRRGPPGGLWRRCLGRIRQLARPVVCRCATTGAPPPATGSPKSPLAWWSPCSRASSPRRPLPSRRSRGVACSGGSAPGTARHLHPGRVGRGASSSSAGAALRSARFPWDSSGQCPAMLTEPSRSRGMVRLCRILIRPRPMVSAPRRPARARWAS